MPYYARSAYYPLPGAPQAGAQLPQQQQQQQFAAPAVPQIDQAFLRQQAQVQAQAQAQQLAYQQQQQQQLQQQQYIEQQNRQLAQQQYYQQQQQQQLLQQQQYAAQQQRLQQEQQYALQQQQQQALQQQQFGRQQQRSGYQGVPAVCQQTSPAAPLYKSSEYVQSGGGYQTGGALSQPLRRVPSRADVNTAIENPEAPFGQGLTIEQQRSSTYNPYANYGQAVAQSPIRPQRASQREPSEYAYDGLNPVYRQPQQQQQYAQDRDLPTAREQPSASNVWLGARSLNAPTTVVLDANNNAAPAPLAPRSPARGYGGQQQRGYGTGAQAESAYIGIPNDLHYAQNNQQRAYNNYGQESRPVYASSSRTNQIAPSTPKLKPAAARELYAALSSENVRTALERDAPVTLLAQVPAFSTYNGQRVQGRAFVIPADQKYSEYNLDDLNGLRSVIDAPIR